MTISGSRSFRAIATAVVPEAVELTAAEWGAFDSVIAGALSRRPAAVQRQLRLFLRILSFLSLIRYGRPLSALSTEQRHSLLKRIEGSRLLLFRRGFWGIRTLVLMGYYARPETGVALGYAANTRGWEARR